MKDGGAGGRKQCTKQTESYETLTGLFEHLTIKDNSSGRSRGSQATKHCPEHHTFTFVHYRHVAHLILMGEDQ